MKASAKNNFLLLTLFITGCMTTTPNSSPLPSPIVEENRTPNQAETLLPTPALTRLPEIPPSQTEEVNIMPETFFADVLSVIVTGELGAYQFAVEISSPDTGCDQYSDWWEVLSEDGKLLYRRILLHSHVGEQPFTRSGGPVSIGERETVIVRAHMNEAGYGGFVFKGNVSQGFESTRLDEDFASEVESQPPQPDGCAF